MKTKTPIEKSLLPKDFFDVIIIGGGASGMMAGGVASIKKEDDDKKQSIRTSVLILEKNTTLGKKLLITGGGRCNVTNNKTDIRVMLAKYKGSDQFLHSPFAQHSVKDTISFFEKRGLAFKEENDGRMFPVTDKAQSVYNVLFTILKENEVTIKTDTEVKKVHKIIHEGKELFEVATKRGTFYSEKVIVATGGVSHKETGSTGDGFSLLSSFGHTIIEGEASLVPIALSGDWFQKLSGISLEHISITSFLDGVKQQKNSGKILFTHTGLSGPAILQMSKHVGELLKYGKVSLTFDLFPKVDEGDLKRELHFLLAQESNKKIKNVLTSLLPASLLSYLFTLSYIDGDMPCHGIVKEKRALLVKHMKALTMDVKGLLGLHKAIVSSGGVALTEIDFKTMESRLIKNLYVTGDILNIDRPSGGYSLQLCWTTGYVAGVSVS